MNYKTALFAICLIIVEDYSLAMEIEKDDSFTASFKFLDLNLGEISDYDEDTYNEANKGYSYWEEEKYDIAESHLEKAAKKRHSYSMSKYALMLLNKEHLLKSQDKKADIYYAADLMLMSAMRQEEIASEYIQELDETVRKITVEKGEDSEEGSTSQDLLETIKLAPTDDIKKWLKGEFNWNRNSYPKPIQDALKLFYLSVLPTLDDNLFTKLTKEAVKEIRALSSESGQSLKGRNVVDLHGYASETLQLGKKISEKPKYSGQSQSQLKGAHNYTFYNTCNKYAYDLDVCLRTANESLSRKIWEDKEGRFVQAQANPMAAGPVYEGLRKWQPTGKEPKNLPDATTFVIDPFYREFSEIFYGHPLWLVEMTHMDTPWKNIKELVNTEYNGKWPHPEGQYTNESPEGQKKEKLKKKYKKEIEAYTKTIDARRSIPYRLFLISLKDQINKAFIVSEDKTHVEIDLRYVSKERLVNHKEDISNAQTLVLKNGVSRKKKWLSDLIDPYQCKTIQYSLDERDNYKEFEKYLCKLRKDNGIVIERTDGPTPLEPEKKEKKKTPKKKQSEDSNPPSQKKEKRKKSKSETSSKESLEESEEVVKAKKQKIEKIEKDSDESPRANSSDVKAEKTKEKKTKEKFSKTEISKQEKSVRKRGKSSDSSQEVLDEQGGSIKVKKKKTESQEIDTSSNKKDGEEKPTKPSSKQSKDEIEGSQNVKKKSSKRKKLDSESSERKKKNHKEKKND